MTHPIGNRGSAAPLSQVQIAGAGDLRYVSLIGRNPVQTLSSVRALTAADIGSIIRYTGAASGGMALPALPVAVGNNGAPIYIKNRSNYTLSLDPGTVGGVPRTVNGVAGVFPFFAGQECEFNFDGVSNWETKNLPSIWKIATVDAPGTANGAPFFLPADIWQFEVEATRIYSAAGVTNPTIGARVAFDAAGTTYDVGASDYGSDLLFISGAGAPTSSLVTASYVANLTPVLPTSPVLASDFLLKLRPGDATANAHLDWIAGGLGASTGAYQFQGGFGARVASGRITGITFFGVGNGNIFGTFVLRGKSK